MLARLRRWLHRFDAHAAGAREGISRVELQGWHLRQMQSSTFLSIATGLQARAQDPLRLHRSYAQMYSQYGEDGYLAEIFRRIGAKSKTFLEVGIGDGVQNTTRLLLEQGWSGFWVEGDAAAAAKASTTFGDYIRSGRLKVLPIMAEPDSIDAALDVAGCPSTLDLITVDIDYSTSHLWRGLERRSRVACVEYNPSLPASAPFEAPYAAGRSWDGTNHYGAGLKTLELIGRDKQMNLVGCDLVGLNAFFVTGEETADLFCQPFTAENHFELPNYGVINSGHAPSAEARTWTRAPEADR